MSTTANSYQDYCYPDASPSDIFPKLLPPILELAGTIGPSTRILDVGCGNGIWRGVF